MPESVLVAIIAGVLSAISAFVGNFALIRKKSHEDAIREAERETRQSMRLDSIEHKLDIHNGYAEKFGDIQKDIAVIKNDIEHFKKGKK